MNLETCTKAQRRVIQTLDAPLMVSAGAGSGKTFTLTQRVAFGLTGGGEGRAPYLDSVNELLAITFTTKAASELKGRIKGLLLDEGLRDEALKVDDAWVSTIHGMASRILREHALEIGIDPAFEVISEAEGEELLEAALEEVVVQARDMSDPLVSELLQTEKLRGAGFNDFGVADYVRSVLDRVRAMPEGLAALDASSALAAPSALMRRLLAAAEELAATLAAASGKVPKTIPPFRERLDGGIEAIREWLAASDGAAFSDDGFDAEAFSRCFYSMPVTTGARIGKDYQEAFAAWWEVLVELDREVRVGLAARWCEGVVRLARLVDESLERLKGPARLDNNDLLVLCARALREHPALAEGLRRKFRLIMVDEFQDTDRLQVDIISRIAQPGLANVCTVGDAQQSIYRFRGADVNVFFEYRRELERLAGGDTLVSMARNFRSHGDILAFVEHIFGQPTVFGDDFLSLSAGSALNQVDDPLFAERPRVFVDVVHNQSGRGGVSKDAARAEAAASIARHFAELCDGGAAVSDMVILLGTMTHADVYAAALREVGIASMIAGGSVFSSAAEPALVSNLLRLAVNPTDDEALYPVLASPLFAVSDDALLVLATRPDGEGASKRRRLCSGLSGSNLQAELSDAGLDEPSVQAVLSCREILGSFVNRARVGSPARALQRLLVESGLLDRLQEQGVEGLASAANLAKAVRLVCTFEATSAGIGTTSASFDAHLATAKEAPGALATAEGDFVRIMTVHASKGLEFPHVVVADLRVGRESAGRLVVENIGQGTCASASFVPDPQWADVSKKMQDQAQKLEEAEAVDVGGLETSALGAALAELSGGERHRALAAYAQSQALAEARRLLYVALTRASKSLYVSLLVSGKPADGYEKAGIFADIFSALEWDTATAPSVSMAAYGGTAPARVSLRYLQPAAEDDEGASAAGVEGDGSDGAVDDPAASSLDGKDDASTSARADKGTDGEAASEPVLFSVPVREEEPAPTMLPFNFMREGLYSYTSLSAAGDGSDGWAGRDEASEESALAEEEGKARVGFEPTEGESATALGTAFHRLAQQAIERAAGGALFRPSEAAIEAQIQKEGLSEGQQVRLHVALDRWLSSDEAARFAAHANLGAEVPFIVEFAPEPSAADGAAPADPFYLEGEIDGLADNGDGAAFLIDYKTGGSPEETPEALDAKHRLQASCYAYALMRAGYTSVDAHFLRIEHVSATNPRDPQIVPYHFTTEDMPALEVLIRERHREATA
ncbi:MAG: UvrD-helicase domain-containing protein [Adlercreutzia sp.]|nr:UvrD-helicase domain-containing protein [Adlercreutzia sp.]